MKKLKLFMAAMIAAITVAGMSGVSAAAGSVHPTSTQNLTITRTITNAKNAITNGFDYTITADSSNPANGVSNFPTTATVDFSATAPSSGTATATGTIDMTGATFSVNGDYEWTITETASDDPTNYPVDSTHSYVIKASVRNSSSTNLSTSQGKVVTFVMFQSDGTTKLGDDPILFTSGTQYKHIEISKEVTGNMADVDLCFDVAVTVGTTGQTYSVSGGCSNPATIAGGTATTLSLKHSDTITIGSANSIDEIPVNTAYSFQETVPTGYTATVNGTAGNTSGNKTVSATDSANQNTIVNNYEQATVTGAFLKVLPYVVIVAIAVAGVVYLVIRNKKQKQIEE